MTEETTTTVTTEATPKAAPKKAAKKTAKKAPAKKAAAKKAPKKKAAKKAAKTTGTRAKKEGLRKPQIRVLKALYKSTRGLNRAEISEKGEVDLAMLNSYIGSHDDKVRAKNDKLVCPSLLTLGYVKHAAQEGEGRGAYYAITANGKKAYEAATAK